MTLHTILALVIHGRKGEGEQHGLLRRGPAFLAPLPLLPPSCRESLNKNVTQHRDRQLSDNGEERTNFEGVVFGTSGSDSTTFARPLKNIGRSRFKFSDADHIAAALRDVLGLAMQDDIY